MQRQSRRKVIAGHDWCVLRTSDVVARAWSGDRRWSRLGLKLRDGHGHLDGFLNGYGFQWLAGQQANEYMSTCWFFFANLEKSI